MSLKLGDQFPDFDVKSTIGDFNLYNYLGDGWGILFSHPADYTPVCTTELGAAAAYAPQFAQVTADLENKSWVEILILFLPESDTDSDTV